MIRHRPHSVLLLAVALAMPALSRADDVPLLPYGSPPPADSIPEVFVAERTVSLVLAELDRETDVARRVRLIADLGLSQQSASLTALARLTNDPEPLVRAAAVRSLAQLKAASNWPAIELKAADESPAVRYEAVRAAQVLGISSGVLVKAMDDADPTVRAIAVSASVDEVTDQALVARLDGLPPLLQANAARALGRRKSPTVRPAIAKLLDDSNLLVRVAALDALRDSGVIERAAIAAQLSHAHPAVRTAAARAIAAVPAAEDRLALVLQVLGDKDLAVRVPAAELAGPLGQTAAVGPLFDQLGQGYEPLRLAARTSLLTLSATAPTDKPAVIAGAVPLLSNATADRREDASYLLGELASDAGFDAHLKLLEDADWVVVNQAARSLGRIGNAGAGNALVQAAVRALAPTDAAYTAWVDAGPQKRQTARGNAVEAAILSCAAIGHVPILDVTKSLYVQKTAHPQARAAGLWALGVLTPGDSIAPTLRSVMGRIVDPEESPAVILEAIKAAGNGRVVALKGALQRLATEQPNDFGRAAHDALDRINGTKTPFVIPTQPQPADTSVQDITPAAN